MDKDFNIIKCSYFIVNFLSSYEATIQYHTIYDKLGNFNLHSKYKGCDIKNYKI